MYPGLGGLQRYILEVMSITYFLAMTVLCCCTKVYSSQSWECRHGCKLWRNTAVQLQLITHDLDQTFKQKLYSLHFCAIYSKSEVMLTSIPLCSTHSSVREPLDRPKFFLGVDRVHFLSSNSYWVLQCKCQKLRVVRLREWQSKTALFSLCLISQSA